MYMVVSKKGAAGTTIRAAERFAPKVGILRSDERWMGY